MVGENCTANFQTFRNENFERVALYPTRDWSEHRKPGAPIVGCRRKDNCRSSARLLMTGLWIKREPNQIPAIGSVAPLTRLRRQPGRQFLFRDDDFVV